MPDKEQIISRISEIRRIIVENRAELEKLESQLRETIEEEVSAAIAAKNDYLREQGLLPKQDS